MSALLGRPSKYSPEVIDVIIDALSVGAPIVHACNAAGISEDTFARWRELYSDFADAIQKAQGKAVAGWLEKIELAAKDGNWQAAAWKLERRYPEDFGRRDRVTVDVNKLNSEFEAAMATLEARGEGGISSDTESTAIN